MEKENQVIIYQGSNGGIEFRADPNNETIWSTQAQMAQVFGVNTQAITRHIKNIYRDKELEENRTCSKMEQVRNEGGRQVLRRVEHYNLDLIIAVGYRVNTVMGTRFRQWATKTLRSYLMNGFVVDRKKVIANYEKFIETIEDIKKVLPANAEAFKSEDALDLIKLFADTWLSIDKYDRDNLDLKKVSREVVKLEAQELQKAVAEFKKVLMKKGEASELFATDRSRDSLEGIVGNVMQSFGGKSVYASVEEKAAHLFYFIIKNHPFTDGNKRTGAFSFIWYLARNKRLDKSKVSPNMLTALTLLVAESDPAHKDRIVKVVMKLIEKK